MTTSNIGLTRACKPHHSEYAFGFEGPPVALSLPDGGGIRFRGFIDRVDMTPDGRRAVVMDYKTGSSRQYAQMADDPLMAGKRLQLPLYALAVRETLLPDATLRAEYWFISAKGGYARVPVSLDAIEEQFRYTVQTIAEGVRGGIFPANPGPPGFGGPENCRYCDFQRICPTNKLALWARKINSPQVAAYKMLGGGTDADAEEGARMIQHQQPADQQHRDRIQHSLEESLFVEAGAGTGKTTALVDRIVNLIASGAGAMAGLAAITFTEAAAAELRDRVRRDLECAAEEESLDEDKRFRCRQAVLEMDAASIQTLHSFAQSLLRELPLEAGLPPGFELLDPIEADLRFQQAWDQWLDDSLESAELGPKLARALHLGLNLDQLRRVALALNEQL